jgi:hypothetical protein
MPVATTVTSASNKPRQLSDANSQGTVLGQGATDLIAFYGATPVAKPTVTGSKGSNAALASLIAQLVALGLITDTTT